MIAFDPRFQSAAPLPPLVIGFYRDGKLVETIEQQDPRELFCKYFNERSPDLVARPVLAVKGGAV